MKDKTMLQPLDMGEYPVVNQEYRLGDPTSLGGIKGQILPKNHWLIMRWGTPRVGIGRRIGRVVAFRTKGDEDVIQDIKLGEHFRVANHTGKMLLKVPGAYLMLADRDYED